MSEHDATTELNAPAVRNDALTVSAVMRHIRLNHAGVLGEFHELVAVREALSANDARVGCEIADSLAAKLSTIRRRFALEKNLRPSL